MASNRNTHRGGRKLVSDRITDDHAPLLGSNLSIPEDLKKRFHETTKFDVKPATKRNYRNRLRTMILRLLSDSAETKAYYLVGTRLVSDDDLADETKYYFNEEKFRRDFIYSGMNDKFILQLFTILKYKKDEKDGELNSLVHLRKFKDAVVWGAKIAEEALPSKLHRTLEGFLKGYDKELTNAKKAGKVVEQSADPIPFVLYKLILQWALESSNIFVWFWTLTQWNMMARCANIDPLRFDNFSLGADSIIGNYDDLKAVNNAQRLSEKNIYANPYNWMMCFWTRMGILLILIITLDYF